MDINGQTVEAEAVVMVPVRMNQALYEELVKLAGIHTGGDAVRMAELLLLRNLNPREFLRIMAPKAA